MLSARENRMISAVMEAYDLPRHERPQTMGAFSILISQLCTRENITRDPEMKWAVSDLLHRARRAA